MKGYDLDSLIDRHSERFGAHQCIVKSPGRANIIGEHTDYNHGMVLPFAIDQSIYLVMSKNTVGKLRIAAQDIDEYHEQELSDLKFQSTNWSRYFNNALYILEEQFALGIDITFGGDLPSGAGVSSSSAITCGFLFGVNELLDLRLTKSQIKALASQAENGIGLMGGMMDQTAIIEGRKNHVIFIDFLSNEVEHIPMDMNGYTFYLFESGQKHNLVETQYNKRRRTCEEAVHLIMKDKHFINTMREISEADVNLYLHDTKMKMRCLHVINENERVEDAVKAIQESNYETLAQLINSTHQSLSQLYEVSTKEIDFLVQESLKIKNILGSRIMGGGFGGCTINLVKGKLTRNAISELKQTYIDSTGLEMKVLEVMPSEGIRMI